MLATLLYIVIAILILSFLIFIHELGHYYVARRVGMRVEAFSIGIGRAVVKWVRDGVEWRLGWLPFGGYVKIAGGDEEDGIDPYDIRDGFFGRPPIDRIKVALAGPLSNLFLALVVFVVLWASGGRVKNFSEFTPTIGWVDAKSELYKAGIRPGDEVTFYGNQPFQQANDHLIAPMTGGSEIRIRGNHVNLQDGQRTPFDVTVAPYSNPLLFDKDLLTTGILDPASYVIFDPKNQDTGPDSQAAGSPLMSSGIQPGDRVVWANGELIFSRRQLGNLINDGRALLTIQRGKKTLLRRIPRVLVQELKLDTEFREELVDWQYEAQLTRKKILKLYTIPYNISAEAVVENPLRFIENDQQEHALQETPFSPMEEALEPGDKIIAVNGTPITHAYELLAQVQEPHLLMVVLRNPKNELLTTWQLANSELTTSIDWEALNKITSAIGLKDEVKNADSLVLLNPISPKTHRDFALSPQAEARYATALAKQRNAAEGIDNPEKRAQFLHKLEESDQQLHLEPPIFVDRKVVYNPSPMRLFYDVFDEIRRTLSALLSGRLSPKWLAGPVGIIQVVQENSQVSLKEGLYWIGVISLNLGILNLLPIPVLDGGSICFSLFEMATGKRIKPKTMEKLIIPFAILILTFLLFLTYQDLLRIFGKFLNFK